MAKTMTNQDCKHEETERKLNFGNTCHDSIQNVSGALKLDATEDTTAKRCACDTSALFVSNGTSDTEGDKTTTC